MTRYRLIVDAISGSSETVAYTAEEEAAAEAAEAASARAFTRLPKDLIWRRATDAEAEAMDTALKSQPARIRRIYDGVQVIDKGGELYGTLHDAMVQLFGETRADELLDPTE